MKNKSNLEIPSTKGMILNTEDIILSTIFREKSCNKLDLKVLTGIDYKNISETVNDMESRGFLIKRKYEPIPTYYLTKLGVYELEYKFNRDYFLYLHFYLEKLDNDKNKVKEFLKNRFYEFYMTGQWYEDLLFTQYRVLKENVLKLK